jgi:hypothetical protein
MSEKVIIGHLNPGDPFFEIFPDGTVPLVHPLPVLFETLTEPCYLVDGSGLSDLQVTQISEGLMHRFPDLNETYEELKASVRKDFPILCSHFEAIRCDDSAFIQAVMSEVFRDFDPFDPDNDPRDEWEPP